MGESFLYNISMKQRVYSIKTVVLCALITLSATFVCAQKWKYKPLPKGAKPVTVPHVVNPKWSRAMQGSITRASGVQVIRTHTAKEAARAAATASIKPSQVIAQTAPKPAVLPATEVVSEALPAVQDTGTNLTGMQVLATYFPTWRQELGGMFSQEQLDAIEKAFEDTDEWMFVQGEDGELTVRNQDEWNYEERFLTILQDSGVSFTERQIKQLLGTRGIRGFTLSGPLKTATLQGYMLAYGKIPRDRIKEKNKLVPTAQYTPEQQLETAVGVYYVRVVSAKHCPSHSVPLIAYIQALGAKYRTNAVPKTPQQYLEEMEDFVVRYSRIPRTEIVREGKKIKPADFTPQEKAEYQLAHGVNGILKRSQNEPTPISTRMAQLKEQFRQIAQASTPDQVLTEVEQFLAQYDRMPLFYLAPANETELTERKLAQRVNNAIKNNKPEYAPAVSRLRALKEANRTRAASMSDEELLSKVTDFIAWYNHWPRKTIRHGGNTLPLDQYSPEEQEEIQLGRAAEKRLQIRDVSQFPVLQKLANIKETYRKHAIVKTPEEHLADLEHFIAAYHRYPNTYILNPTPAQQAEMALAKNVAYNIHAFAPGNAAAAQLSAIKEQYRKRAIALSHQELYQQLLEYLHQNKRLPSEGPLYKSMWGRLDYATRNGGIEDPWLQKIYELKTTVQNAPEGKFTLTPDGQGGYILETEESALEEAEISTPQPVEEVAPVTPSVHTVRLRITEQTKNLIESVRDAAALERRKFSGWLRAMHEPENLPQIVDKNTFDALHTLSKAINFDHRNGQNRRAVTYLLKTVNNYVGALGEQPELSVFYKLIYRGKVDPAMLPSADNFHVVAEEQGLSWDGALAPQVEKVNRLLIQATKQGTPFSVYLDGDEEMLTTIRTEKNVPAKTIHQDLSTVLKHLLPPGYEVRIGLHEIGISGKDMSKFRRGYLHLHLEHASVPDGDMEGLLIDHSISLDVDVRRFAGRWNPRTKDFDPLWDKDIAQNYLDLFNSFLSDDARQTLQEMASSSSK